MATKPEPVATCLHCGRRIQFVESLGYWYHPEGQSTWCLPMDYKRKAWPLDPKDERPTT